MSSTKMRSFVAVESTPPLNLSATGVYNFFTPDERTSEDTAVQFQGASTTKSISSPTSQNKIYYRKRDGSSIAENNLVGSVPRYVMISFQKPTGVPEVQNFNYDLKNAKEQEILYTAEELQSPHDVSMRFTDLSIDDRIRRKLDLALNLETFGQRSIYDQDAFSINSTFSSENPGISIALQANKTSIKPYIKEIAQNLVNSNMASEVEDVNEVSTKIDPDPIILDSKTMSLFATVNRSYIDDVFSSSVISKRLSSDVIKSIFKDDDYLDSIGGPGGREITDLEIKINADSKIINGSVNNPSKVELAGYMIERYEVGETNISSQPERTYFISRPDLNTFLDVRVKYGVLYTYTVRSIYRVTHTVSEVNGSNRELISFVGSQPSDPVSARVVEFNPPAPPDGVMYNFNYSERRGLRISWQYPVGTQRDTKYFQVFRRKTINEPFTCIGMIDFDNSVEKTPPREFVREDKVIKYQGSVTYFEDTEFYKDSTYIYAICSVDAHGYTSGYSVQTKVSFRKSENKLILKRISKHGAPKQYPNFFVDPDEDQNTFVNTLTQDAMKTSGFNRMRIYFDPDGLKYRKKVTEVFDTPIFVNKQIFYVNRPADPPGSNDPDQGVYKLVMINTDRQKAKTIEVSVEDARGTGFFPA